MIEEWDSGHLPEVGRKAERDQVEIPMIKGLKCRYIISFYQENMSLCQDFFSYSLVSWHLLRGAVYSQFIESMDRSGNFPRVVMGKIIYRGNLHAQDKAVEGNFPMNMI